MNDNIDSARRETRRDQMASLLARYPGVDSDDLADLLHWFKKEASALDVGLIASDPTLKAPYEAIKKDHIDRLNGADLFWVAMLVGGGFIALAVLIWSAL